MSDAELKREAKRILGGRCANPECRWLNEDGSLSCTDERALTFDHIGGGGSESRREGKDSVRMICYEIKRNARYQLDRALYRFQLLCANCHEIKAKGEKHGAHQHKQPARVRRSLQNSGAEPRRVRVRQSN
jgi:hypothetical protein